MPLVTISLSLPPGTAPSNPSLLALLRTAREHALRLLTITHVSSESVDLALDDLSASVTVDFLVHSADDPPDDPRLEGDRNDDEDEDRDPELESHDGDSDD